MMIYDAPPFAIVGRKSKGITAEPASLVGKKFGAPAADGAYAQWPIFKSVNKLDDSTMKFENVGFPVREPMLASGDVDAVFGFSFSVYLNLKSRGLPVDDIVVMLMRDHGVDLYGNVLMVSPKFAAEKPDAVKGFIKALIKGTRDTVADPAAATATVIKRNDVAKQDVEKERLDLALAQNIVTSWVKANGYGGIDKDRFAKAIDQIGLTFTYKSRPKVEDVFTEAFLPPAADRKVN
jgi:NitT/TauT family transport system substrate-binding protein